MIRDAQGRKWFMRFRHYKNGWWWQARCDPRKSNLGLEANAMFKTKALAERDARTSIQSKDHVAEMAEFFRRLNKRGSECQLTREDVKAIERAGANRR